MLKRLPMVCLCAAALFAPLSMPASRASAGTPLQDAIATLAPQDQATLKAYDMAQLAHARHVDQYWRLIDLKRRKRKAKIAAGKTLIADDYVHEQPPVYQGPERPAEIMAQLPKPPKPVVPAHEPIPLVADFLREADAVYGFKPDRIGEDEFMFYYALEFGSARADPRSGRSHLRF